MQKRTYAAAATIALMLLTACGEEAPESGPSDGNPATETKSFTVAFTSHGISHAPTLAALEQLRQDGYEIEAPVLAESELVTAGTAQGQFAFGVAATGSMLTAVSKGANLKAVVLRNANEWTVWGQQDISECADLDGKRLAIHSPGGDSTKMVERYVETTCPGTEPSYVVVSGSSNRLAALLANEIDASPLELSDAITLQSRGEGRYRQLASFAESLPDLYTDAIYVNGDFAEANPEAVTAFVRAVVEQHREIAGNPEYLVEIANTYVPDVIDQSTVEEVARSYVELEIFPENAELTEEGLKYTMDFFGPDGTGATDKIMPVEEFADLTFLNEVLDELGRR
ncbi:ABC transporter substrate-binding protein [Actinophytocola sp.]|uniref:ABC transporter substrate-binding protein n=1 Tax=Actinophytocola sp. TaxID=1872138 RepID=UPI003D6A499D